MHYNDILKYLKSEYFWIICFIILSILLTCLLLCHQYEKRVIVASILGLGIICFALYSSISYVALHPNDNGNYVSLFTGWLGGICTAILGCMAVIQSRAYNSENNDFLIRQERIQQNMVDENRRQTQRLIEYQNNIDLRQSMEQLIEDIKLFIIEIDFLNLLQEVGNGRLVGDELYLRCLQCEIKINMLQRRLNASSIYIINQGGRRIEIGTEQKKELSAVLNQLLEVLMSYISDYLKGTIKLEKNIELHKVELTQLCFEICKKYYLLLDTLNQYLCVLGVN